MRCNQILDAINHLTALFIRLPGWPTNWQLYYCATVIFRYVPPEQARVIASVQASISGSSASSTSSTPEVLPQPLKTLHLTKTPSNQVTTHNHLHICAFIRNHTTVISSPWNQVMPCFSCLPHVSVSVPSDQSYSGPVCRPGEEVWSPLWLGWRYFCCPSSSNCQLLKLC